MSNNNANCHKKSCPLYKECWLSEGEQTCLDRLGDYEQGRADGIDGFVKELHKAINLDGIFYANHIDPLAMRLKKEDYKF